MKDIETIIDEVKKVPPIIDPPLLTFQCKRCGITTNYFVHRIFKSMNYSPEICSSCLTNEEKDEIKSKLGVLKMIPNSPKPPSDMHLSIPLSIEDHAFVESVCTNNAFNFKTFFSHLLELYKKSLNENPSEASSKESRKPSSKESSSHKR